MLVGALEVFDKGLPKVGPVMDGAGWQMIEPGPRPLRKVDLEELDDSYRLILTFDRPGRTGNRSIRTKHMRSGPPARTHHIGTIAKAAINFAHPKHDRPASPNIKRLPSTAADGSISNFIARIYIVF